MVYLPICTRYKANSMVNSKEIGKNEILKTSYIILNGQGGKLLGTRGGSSVQHCSDDTGGAFIIWDDTLIYVQRINSSGDLQWIESGIRVSQSSGAPSSPDICKDNNGGAIITWHHGVTSSSEKNIYAQKVNATGDLQWDINSIIICAASGIQATPRICSDGSGGAIIVWRDYRRWPGASNYPNDVYVQRVNSTGDIQWAHNGVLISETNSQGYPNIISDGEGGAIVAWEDQNNIYAQKINSSGDIQWDSNEMPICEAIASQIYPVMCIDGLGGVFFSWSDERNYATTEYDIYAQRVNSTGDIQWEVNGTPIIRKNYDQKQVQICNDGSGNAILTWVDLGASLPYTVYTQKIDIEGNSLWNPTGIELGNAYQSYPQPQICVDGAGGAFIAWYHFDINTTIRAQHVDSMGYINWYDGGIIASNSVTKDLGICSDEFGGCIITWSRYSDEYRVYTQIISNQDSKPISNHPDDIALNKTFSKSINWSLQDDFGGGQYRVLINDSEGNIIVWNNWTGWTNNSIISIPINNTAPGTFNYIIEFYDNKGQLGIPDKVLVTIIDMIPTSNHLGFITTTLTGTETIGWILTDDWGGGQYRVWANDTSGNYYVWQDWQPWTNNTPLNVPINRAASGVFNYTIDYYDAHNLYGSPDTVIVIISAETVIPLDHYYLVFILGGVIALIVVIKRKIFIKN